MKKTFIYISSIFIILFNFCQTTPTYNIIAIGDSNGEHENGWVHQLKKIRPQDTIINYSISGATIGFDNLGKDTLNTLKNINTYLSDASKKVEKIDNIIVLLGTNDCKAVFDSLQDQVILNLEKLITEIQSYPFNQKNKPTITLVTPPPIPNDSMLITKYQGGKKRLENLLPVYKTIAKDYKCVFIDIYKPLAEDYLSLTVDGIHLNEEGYVKMAKIINDTLFKFMH